MGRYKSKFEQTTTKISDIISYPNKKI